MPIPQLTDRIKEAPAMVLRALFAGVGQVLLAVDKIRTEVLDRGDQGKASQPAGTAGRPTAPPPAKPAEEEPGNVRVLREPGRPAAAPPEAPQPAEAGTAEAKPAEAKPAEAVGKPAAAKPAPAKPATAKPATAKPAGRPAAAKPSTAKPPGRRTAAKPPAAKPAAAEKPAASATAEKPASPAAAAGAPPLANYDELTVASLRARMRGLDAAGLRGLLAYEKSHANRETVTAMYERRLEKLASGAG